MTIATKTREELHAENAELRLRLGEAEETLQAISSGTVDAVVISRPGGNQVFTLEGADYSYRVLVESINEGAATLSSDGVILYGNSRLARMLGLPLDRVIGATLGAHVHPDHCLRFATLLQSCRLEDQSIEITLIGATGMELPVQLSCCAIELSGGARISAVLTDLSATKRAEEKILRLNRLYSALCAVNHAIVQVKDRELLFAEFCRVAVEIGAFRLAWIGLVDQATGVVRVVAGHGETGYLEGLRKTVNQEPDGMGPIGIALRAGEYHVCNDFSHADITLPWHDRAEAFGLAASASIAIREDGKVIGALTLYSGEKDFFDQPQVELLREMGRDISFALDNLLLEERVREAELQARMATERAQAAEALRASEMEQRRQREFLECLIEHAGTCISVVTGAELRYSMVNPAYQAIAPGMEMVGRPYREVFPEAAAAGAEALVRQVLETGTPWKLEAFQAGVPGKPDATWQGYVVRLPLLEGDEPSVLTVTWDITEQVRAQEALQLSEEKFARAFASNAAAIAITRLEDGVFLEVNDTWVRMNGRSRKEVLGRSAREMEIWPSREAAQGFVEVLKSKGWLRGWEQEFRKKSGEPFIGQLAAQVMEVRGEPAILSTIVDITSRIRAERALKELNEHLETRVGERTAELARSLELFEAESAERLRAVEELRQNEQLLIQQSRLAALGEMIGNIAHQWRQPLNALGLLIQQTPLLYQIGEVNQELLNRSAEQSMELVRHMSRTIDDFRNFFRPDKEKVQFRLKAEIEKTMSLVEASFREMSIEINLEAAGDPTVEGFPNEFSKVVLNILINARDVFAERGTVSPSVRIEVGTGAERGFTTVRDNAGGISEEILEKVFDPYFTTKGPQHGTGVGLFMSKNIIEKNMGGRLTVRNALGGAEFRIEVPCAN